MCKILVYVCMFGLCVWGMDECVFGFRGWVWIIYKCICTVCKYTNVYVGSCICMTISELVRVVTTHSHVRDKVTFLLRYIVVSCFLRNCRPNKARPNSFVWSEFVFVSLFLIVHSFLSRPSSAFPSQWQLYVGARVGPMAPQILTFVYLWCNRYPIKTHYSSNILMLQQPRKRQDKCQIRLLFYQLKRNTASLTFHTTLLWMNAWHP